MRELIRIRVECHSGYRADEYPRCFYWNDKRYDIIQVTDRWYQGGMDPGQHVSNYFRIETACRGQYLIKHDLEYDTWYLVQSSTGN